MDNHNTIIKKLAVLYDTDEEIIQSIIKSQFRFVKDTMEQGELESVHLHHLGKFAIKPNRLKRLKENGYKPKVKLKYDN